MNYDKANNIKFNDIYYIKDTFPDITLSYLPQEILTKLKRVYAGNKSELTCITQYIYQHFVMLTIPKLNDLSNNMQEIAIREMIHYEILAKILIKCGIDPKNCVYIDGNPNLCDYWKASNVTYEKSLMKMFEGNILLKQRTIDQYIEIIEKTDNENLKHIISRILEDERSHLIYFKAVLKELKN